MPHAIWYYIVMRQKLKLVALFFGPSINSGFISGILAVVLLAGANYSYLSGSSLVFDFLFGKGTPYDLIQSSKNTASVVNQTVLGNPLLNKILFFGFWMMIGLFVYAAISVLSQSITDTEDDVEQMKYMNARKTKLQHDIYLRLAIRAGGVLAACIYGWIFISIIFPYCVLASRVGLDKLFHISGILYIVISYIVILLALHIVVIIARLIVLRPRVFGEWDNLG